MSFIIFICLLSCIYGDIYTSILCSSKEGSFSSANDDAVSAIDCDSNQKITSCGWNGPWKNNDGACIIPQASVKSPSKCNGDYNNPKGCMAKSNGTKTAPKAHCCSFGDNTYEPVITCKSYTSGQSPSPTLSTVTRSCELNEKLFGCSMYTYLGKMKGNCAGNERCDLVSDGSAVTSQSCTSVSAGNGVFAVATCCTITGNSQFSYGWECIQKKGGWSSNGDDAASSVSCPITYELLSCGVWTNSNGLIDSVYTSNGTSCIARNSIGHDGVQAIALCCRMPVYTNAPTKRPTNKPTIKPI